MRALLRQPLLHFLLLGGLLLAAERSWEATRPGAVWIDEATVEDLRAQWRRDTGRWPETAELQASLRRQIDEELLLREALRLGLDSKDAVARRQLLANLRFALGTEDAPATGPDDEALLAEARRLDLPARDLVVRRRLIQLMEHRLLAAQLPREAELQAYVAERSARYARAARYRLSQHYFSLDGRGLDAALALARQAQGLLAQDPAAAVGEPFLLDEALPDLTQAELAARLGPEFAEAVAAAAPGTWIGPVRSPYGAHLLRVEALEPAAAPDYAAVRTQAAYAWLAEFAPQRLQAALAPLRARYRVELAPALEAQGLTAGLAEAGA